MSLSLLNLVFFSSCLLFCTTVLMYAVENEVVPPEIEIDGELSWTNNVYWITCSIAF